MHNGERRARPVVNLPLNQHQVFPRLPIFSISPIQIRKKAVFLKHLHTTIEHAGAHP
ncbi:MAG: hypothetical protein ABIN13_02295 [Mucilaginibacter sp.]